MQVAPKSLEKLCTYVQSSADSPTIQSMTACATDDSELSLDLSATSVRYTSPEQLALWIREVNISVGREVREAPSPMKRQMSKSSLHTAREEKPTLVNSMVQIDSEVELKESVQEEETHLQEPEQKEEEKTENANEAKEVEDNKTDETCFDNYSEEKIQAQYSMENREEPVVLQLGPFGRELPDQVISSFLQEDSLSQKQEQQEPEPPLLNFDNFKPVVHFQTNNYPLSPMHANNQNNHHQGTLASSWNLKSDEFTTDKQKTHVPVGNPTVVSSQNAASTSRRKNIRRNNSKQIMYSIEGKYRNLRENSIAEPRLAEDDDDEMCEAEIDRHVKCSLVNTATTQLSKPVRRMLSQVKFIRDDFREEYNAREHFSLGMLSVQSSGILCSHSWSTSDSFDSAQNYHSGGKGCGLFLCD